MNGKTGHETAMWSVADIRDNLFVFSLLQSEKIGEEEIAEELTGLQQAIKEQVRLFGDLQTFLDVASDDGRQQSVNALPIDWSWFAG